MKALINHLHHTFFSFFEKNLLKRGQRKKRKYSCFWKCGWHKKSSPQRPQIYFFKSIFRRYSLFFFSFFCFFDYCFFCLFVRCFLKWKMYILIHIWLCGRVSDKKSFNKPISGNKTTFFGLGCASNASSEKSVVNLYTKRFVFFPLNGRHMPRRFLACI